MVHGILQFTPGIAFCYVLHRCESRDIRCRESCVLAYHHCPGLVRQAGRGPKQAISVFLDAIRRRGFFLGHFPSRRRYVPHTERRVQAPSNGGMDDMFTVCFGQGHDNDPSAGSPTETLLRLLLPLNDKVQWTSRDVGGGEPPQSPRSEHFTGPFNR